ncbi:hypothetical protein LC087_13000 [Bacillus carboniphilus]|uniref:Uncharacterized protein n=1 Tax=Bacillus carboniphilus TaxID=86663 RepID=A0ABY9JQT5_9BACI|nr:hypothetical protein [Bacillus carboniphilus]WLR41767.1 hypothetical protein LC087_13000 [Bacillus carboniphilus]
MKWKEVKLYNVIFPIWLVLFSPPVIFISLIGNFLIDSIVILVCFYLFKISKLYFGVKDFYNNSIGKVWLFGFLSDFIGMLVLLAVTFLDGVFFDYYELASAISYDPFSHPLAVVIIVFAMGVASFFIYWFNHKYTFKHIIPDIKVRRRVSITIAIMTLPWTYLLPTKWFF